LLLLIMCSSTLRRAQQRSPELLKYLAIMFAQLTQLWDSSHQQQHSLTESYATAKLLLLLSLLPLQLLLLLLIAVQATT
jgi:hypothetical protein